MLKLHNMYKVYSTDEVETVALNCVNLEVDQGDFVAIMGPSGCGKSTLLNIIGMLDNPSDGNYWFFDEDIAGYTETQRSALRKQNIGFIFQSFNLIDELSVAENIELALLYHNMPAAERKKRVTAVMDRMGIAHRANHMPGQLSGGQQQRVAVARAVVGDQPLILADEPTGNLDSVHGQEVMELLRSLNKEGTTIVMVTHSPAHADYAHRTVNLFDGHVVTENTRAA
ncbi:MAG: ABC transporter ATP-binding protein [Gammaproteobacteria bacterium]|nr:ABC transporter ATP-binding protein [Gammaproteobacteria bacterium]MDH5241508.1 ABC transporter ATP-binding protein [Gammaproteobacteria bacterium]MDH5261130.1 ABC transporter ATP-binding protein [Gammaproteobacteria bacterium]MDH5584983.1 ABC transporter ATP-binding protein [Gammaproteobacteria bacterium]